MAPKNVLNQQNHFYWKPSVQLLLLEVHVEISIFDRFFSKEPFKWDFEHVSLTYWGTSHVLTNLIPHRNYNNINFRAVYIIFNSVLSLTKEFSTTQISNLLELCATKKILYELTILSPSLSRYVPPSLSYFFEIYLSMFMTGFPLDPWKTITFSFFITISSRVKALSHLSRNRFTS